MNVYQGVVDMQLSQFESFSVFSCHFCSLHDFLISIALCKAELRYDAQMNWKKTIAEIQERGNLTQAEIAQKCGTGQSTISSLIRREGANPTYPLGVMLLEMHQKYTRKPKRVKEAA